MQSADSSGQYNGAQAPQTARRSRILLLIGIVLIAGGVALLIWRDRLPAAPAMPAPRPVDVLTPQTVAAMDSPAFAYSDGWRVDTTGADPSEPADPWRTPAGTVSFAYTGRELALNVAPGDYWGYLFVTVDGAPANALPSIAGNVDSRGAPAGYTTLYAPERPTGDTGWVVVQRSDADRRADGEPHQVYVEVWRSWGQTPLRAVAIDALPAAPPPVWPGMLLLVSGLLCVLAAVAWWPAPTQQRVRPTGPARLADAAGAQRARDRAHWLALGGGALTVLGSLLAMWWLALAGIGLLALAGLLRPALWLGAFLAALPFYFSVTVPLLPQRSFSIIDLGVLGGGVLLMMHGLFFSNPRARRRPAPVEIAAVVLAGWALVSASATVHPDVARYEWRTVFLYGALFLVMVTTALHRSEDPARDRRLLVAAWLGGATVMAALGVWQFAAGTMTITAEGVQRVRGLYGSPNNLALYLERTLAVTLALALFLRRDERRATGTSTPWTRVLLLLAALVQGAALLLTFSKGALFIAMPVMLATLWLGGFGLLRRQGRATRPLWALAGLAALLLLALLPFLGTARFQRIFDLSQGTGFLRLQLWRSAWQMALDHPLLGIGPDNFLYQYRSGYLLPTAWQEPNLNHPHNWLLDWWTRLGIPGLALGLWYWGAGLTVIGRGYRRARDNAAALCLGLLAASAAALAHGLIDVNYALPDLMMVWSFMFALALSLVDASERSTVR